MRQRNHLDWKRFAWSMTVQAVLLTGLRMTSAVALPGYAGEKDPAGLFQSANACYREGRYDQAALIYRKLSDEGYVSGSLFYNLGTTYLRLGKKGLAVLYFEKARRLLPRDRDLRYNLKQALAGIDEGSIPLPVSFCRELLYIAPPDFLAAAASGLFFLFIFLLCWNILPRHRNRSGAIKGKISRRLMWTAGFLCLAASLISVSTYLERKRTFAVVVEEGSQVYYEPDAGGAVFFRQDAGARVYIIKTKGDWALIKRLDGKQGWMRESYCRKV
ncbi:MAG: hypothetical protein ACM3WV_08865 [Bacillota bacterium]